MFLFQIKTSTSSINSIWILPHSNKIMYTSSHLILICPVFSSTYIYVKKLIFAKASNLKCLSFFSSSNAFSSLLFPRVFRFQTSERKMREVTLCSFLYSVWFWVCPLIMILMIHDAIEIPYANFCIMYY